MHNQDQCKVKKEKKLLIIEVNFVNAYAFKQGKHINWKEIPYMDLLKWNS